MPAPITLDQSPLDLPAGGWACLPVRHRAELMTTGH